MSWRLSALFGAAGLTLWLAGCVAGPTDSEPANSGGTGGGGTTGSGGDGGSCPSGDCNPAAACETSKAGSPLLRRLTARELEATLVDVFPEAAGHWTSRLSSDPVSHFGFDNEAARLVVGKQTARDIDDTAAAVGAAVSSTNLASTLPCSASAADAACGGEFLAKYGRRLFRRPLTAEETTTYSSFFSEALAATASFPQAVSWLTKALIHSPATLYRSEIGALLDTSRELSQYEIATALSFTYTGTTPSDALLDKAERGELGTPDALVAAAADLVKTERGRAEAQRFFETFLEYGRVTTVTKSSIPNFDELRVQMLRETRAFIAGVILDGGGGLDDLLTSDVTYPSVALAAHYGMPAPNADYQPVTRTTGRGILAQGSVLSTEASVANSSPTQRGLLVLEKLLCREPPIVPPTVPELPPPNVGVTTTRQRYEELHAAAGACKNCHAAFDPIGFGFEHFDEVGRYREDEGPGLPVNSASIIPFTNPQISFQGQEDLAAALVELDEVQLCVTGQLKTFSFGTEEACLGEGRRAEFMARSIGFVDYWTSLASEPHFSTRSP